MAAPAARPISRKGPRVTIRNLEFALHPRSVAVFGASERPGSVGAVVMGNILKGGFEGPVWPVNAEASPGDGSALLRLGRGPARACRIWR